MQVYFVDVRNFGGKVCIVEFCRLEVEYFVEYYDGFFYIFINLGFFFNY